jgi:hypothetical protein
MPLCPACGRQYEPHIQYCETCEVRLVDSAKQEETHAVESEDYDLAELARFSNVANAEMVKELLEANGIDTVIKGEMDPIGITSRAEATILLVENRNLGRAQEIHEAFFAGDALTDNPLDQD